MKHIAVLVLLSVAVIGVSCRRSANPEEEQAAVGAAQAWLKTTDSGAYAESWQQAASFLRGAVQPEDWERSMMSFRAPFGNMVSRDVKSTRYRTSMPGAPDGQYVMIQFNTSFQNKRSALETVTAMRETNGTWRVSGYFIR